MYDLVVVGAGPYGLSIASHAAAAGLNLRVLGRPMASWRDHMPKGMFLKSEPWSSNLSDPAGTHTLAAYCAARGITVEHGKPLPIGTFTDYGQWFGNKAAPAAEEQTATSIIPCARGFRVETAEGDVLVTRTVAVAVGVMPFVHKPGPLRKLPPGLVSHSSHHRDLSRFSNKDVTVVGAGQAALETAALLAEAGAHVRVVARTDRINWNSQPQPLQRSLLKSLRDPHCGLGTGWPSWVFSEMPWAVRKLPGALRQHIARTALGPAGAWWLRDRFEFAVPVLLGSRLSSAEQVRDQVRLRLESDDGAVRTVETDHVVAATGFSPRLARLAMLDESVRSILHRVGTSDAPELNARFESSHPGLFFAGLLATPSFGPSMRFVYGATFAAHRVVQGVQRRLAEPRLATVPHAARSRAIEQPGRNGQLTGYAQGQAPGQGRRRTQGGRGPTAVRR
ncbi:lysine N(6)-hydroxylase/L-ornithine N(5)-oxygenase family protein [Streptomyces bathyalis]|uniref:Lysine N(6)-hydroxylase/L-ornithine N(5)-oxygenase family protein n=1 Tax=Streptomyces bathyalis TaxID=2710756 RepID=A0A7T1T675_9ACTN|nr:NAD(P)-binding domain-containing protein [Streptomyces bathyalis]QPP07142.1 lysine N(6)-hydroxylase/L-ornithine N(5)-oxygenase family protein [Streptomyces bathyalis]